MYQGQKSKKRAPKKRRSTKRRKKNPSMGAKIGIGVAAAAAAAAIGGGVWWWKKKRIPELPEGAPKGGGNPNKPAPPAPTPSVPESSVEDRERNEVASALESHMKFGANKKAVPMSKADSITDKAFYKVWPELDGKKIPANYGADWAPYVESWVRMNKVVREAIKSYNSAIEDGSLEAIEDVIDAGGSILDNWF